MVELDFVDQTPNIGNVDNEDERSDPPHKHSTIFPLHGERFWSSRLLRYITYVIAGTAVATLLVGSVVKLLPRAFVRPVHHGAQVAPRVLSPGTTVTKTTAVPRTFLGTDGVEASWVIEQNKLAGSAAWNPYGGYDFYTGLGRCPADSYPICSRARVVSFDRPYAYGSGAGDFLANEYPLVYWAEEHGLDVTYWTDLTVSQHTGLLSQHKAILSLGHDECWSLKERQAVENANRQQGLNVVFFGASPMLRHVRSQASSFGPDREEVDYRNSQEDPLYGHGNPLEVTGNTWASPPASWSGDQFVGETYSGYTLTYVPAQSFIVADGSAWIYRNTGLHTGSKISAVIGSDFDRVDPELVHPPNIEILGHSPLPLGEVQTRFAGPGGVTYSDMTYYSDPTSGGGVFDSGTNNWIYSLRSCPSGHPLVPPRWSRR